tara:strand:+ start:19371 stop:19649 length:279 start_codon:yes stop_codon:yes gene_type:complete
VSGEIDSAVALAEIAGKFDIMLQNIETVKDRQEDMAQDIAHIREAVYDPKEGLYARIRDLESWKETSARLLWIVITSVVGLTAATIYKLVMS